MHCLFSIAVVLRLCYPTTNFLLKKSPTLSKFNYQENGKFNIFCFQRKKKFPMWLLLAFSQTNKNDVLHVENQSLSNKNSFQRARDMPIHCMIKVYVNTSHHGDLYERQIIYILKSLLSPSCITQWTQYKLPTNIQCISNLNHIE